MPPRSLPSPVCIFHKESRCYRLAAIHLPPRKKNGPVALVTAILLMVCFDASLAQDTNLMSPELRRFNSRDSIPEKTFDVYGYQNYLWGRPTSKDVIDDLKKDGIDEPKRMFLSDVDLFAIEAVVKLSCVEVPKPIKINKDFIFNNNHLVKVVHYWHGEYDPSNGDSVFACFKRVLTNRFFKPDRSTVDEKTGAASFEWIFKSTTITLQKTYNHDGKLGHVFVDFISNKFEEDWKAHPHKH